MSSSEHTWDPWATVPGTDEPCLLCAADRLREAASAAELAQDLAQAMSVPIQFLAVNLHFLRTSHERLSLLLGLHRACQGNYPEPMAARLKRAEESLDVAYFEMETAKVLEETEEGLARVARIVGAMREFAQDPRAADGGRIAEGGYHHVS